MEDNGVSLLYVSSFVHLVLMIGLSTDTIDVMVERTSHLASPPLSEPSLILGPIISRGWRVPAALTPPTVPLLVLPSTRTPTTSVLPANHLFSPSRILFVLIFSKTVVCKMYPNPFPCQLFPPQIASFCRHTPEGQRLCSPFVAHTRSAVGVVWNRGVLFLSVLSVGCITP